MYASTNGIRTTPAVMDIVDSFPSSIRTPRLLLVSPSREINDSNVAAMLSDASGSMRYLSSMSKSSDGGWTVQQTRSRRQWQENMHKAKGGLFCEIMFDKNGISGDCINSAVVTYGGESHPIPENYEFAGICGFRTVDWGNHSAEMGIILMPKFFGRGLCAECHLAVLEYAFNHLLLQRIQFVTASTNVPMIRFLEEKLGAKHEGTLRDFFANSSSSRDAGASSAGIFFLAR